LISFVCKILYAKKTEATLVSEETKIRSLPWMKYDFGGKLETICTIFFGLILKLQNFLELYGSNILKKAYMSKKSLTNKKHVLHKWSKNPQRKN
jgi:hypothetical protein